MSDSILFKYSDFFNNDGYFEKVKNDFNALGDALIKKAQEVKKEAQFLDPNNLKSLTDLEQKMASVKQQHTQYTKAVNNLKNAQTKLSQARKKATKASIDETEALKKQRAEARQIAKLKQTQAGTIENLRAKLAVVTTQWTKLTEAEIKNTKRGQRLNRVKTQLTKTLFTLERATGDARRGVGQYERALGRARTTLVSFAQAAGVSLGVFGAFRLIRNSTEIIRDFEKANATLAGILNKTTAETTLLQEDAKRLGSTTVKTASEVTSLQIAYARLGFTQDEIIDLTEATINGSIALNAELDETAALVGAMVNSFDGLNTTDAPKIMETLTAATTNSALNFEKLNTALPIVAGAANAVGLSLEDTVAVLGKLSDAGIDASTASTAFRNILIESAARGIDYREAIEKVRKSTDKLTTANEIFGKRAAVSAVVVAKNTEAVGELTEKLENAAVVQKLVDNELNTLDGSLKLLQSAWEGYILKLNDASNGGNILSKGIRTLAENLETIIKVIAIAASTWVAYRVATIASNAATAAGITITKGMTIAQNINVIATKAATAAQRAFNLAMKSNPIGLIVALLAAAVTAYIAFADATDDAAKAQKRFNDIKTEAKKIETETISVEKTAVDEEIRELERAFAVRKARGEDAVKLEKEFAKKRKDILIREIDENQKVLDEAQGKLDKAQEKRDKALKFSQQLSNDRSAGQFAKGDANASSLSAFQNFQDVNAQVAGVIEARNNEIKRLEKALIDTESEVTVKTIEETKKRNKAYEDRIKELALLRRRYEDLLDEKIVDDEARETAIIKRKFDREIQAIKGNSEIEIKLRKELELRKQSEISDIQEKYAKKRLDEIAKIDRLELDYIKDDIERELALERERSDKILEQIETNAAISLKRKKALMKKEKQRLNEFETTLRIKGDLKELEDLNAINTARIELDRKNFTTSEAFEKYKAARFLEIQTQYINERIELLEKLGSEENKVEIEQLRAELAKLTTTFPGDDLKDKYERLGQAIRETFTRVFDVITRKQQEAVNQMAKAIDEQKQLVDNQRKLAEQGLVNTLAFEQKQLAKAEKEKVKRQERLERLEKAKALYASYSNYQQQGAAPGEAITRALADFAILEAITASFGDGGVVEDKLPTDGIFRGQSHKGNKKGIAIRVEGKEGIFSTREMENLGKDNFYKIKNLAGMGKLTPDFFNNQSGNVSMVPVINHNNSDIKKELRDVKQAIENKPVQNWDVPGLVDGVLQIVETRQQKNKTIRTKFKVKRNGRN